MITNFFTRGKQPPPSVRATATPLQAGSSCLSLRTQKSVDSIASGENGKGEGLNSQNAGDFSAMKALHVPAGTGANNDFLAPELDQIRSKVLVQFKPAVAEFLEGPMRPLVKDDMPERIQEFREKEPQYSKANPDHITKPSGPLNADLLLLLHYPTFNTSPESITSGETADPQNICLRFVMEKGFHPANCLFLDRYNRRCQPIAKANRKTKDETPMDRWHPELLYYHQSFSDLIMKDCTAKVCLMFGARNKQMYLASHNCEVVQIKLNEETKPTNVAVEYTAADGKVVKRVVVFCQHPEWLLRRQWFIKKGLKLDQAMNIAAVLTNMPVDPTFAHRFYIGVEKIKFTAVRAKGQVQNDGFVFRRDTVSGRPASWDAPLNIAHDAQSLTLAKLLAITQDHGDTEEYDCLHARLQQWLTKSKKVVNATQAKRWMERCDVGASSLLDVIHAQLLMEYETAIMITTPHIRFYQGGITARGKDDLLNVAYEEADVNNRHARTMKVACNTCALPRMDLMPLYYISGGHYVIKDLRCPQCKKNRMFYPVHKQITFITRHNLKADYFGKNPNTSGAEDWRTHIAKDREKARLRKAKSRAKRECGTIDIQDFTPQPPAVEEPTQNLIAGRIPLEPLPNNRDQKTMKRSYGKQSSISSFFGPPKKTKIKQSFEE